MPTFTLVSTAAAPPETVFDVLTDHASYASITPVRRAELEREGSSERNGVGAIRRLHVVGPPLREEVTEFERPERFAYRLLSGAPMRDHVGTVVLTPYGEGTQVAYTLTTTPAIPFTKPIAMRIVRTSIGQLLKGVVNEAERQAKSARP